MKVVSTIYIPTYLCASVNTYYLAFGVAKKISSSKTDLAKGTKGAARPFIGLAAPGQ